MTKTYQGICKRCKKQYIGRGKTYCSWICRNNGKDYPKYWLHKKHSSETKEKIKQARLKQDDPRIGKVHTNKTKKIISNKVKGFWQQDDYKKHMSLAHKGQHSSPATEFKFVKGRPFCKDCNKQLINYDALYCKYHSKIGNRNWNWKGDSVGYGALHTWIKKRLGKPQKCEHCQSTNKKMYHWANKSGTYKRNLSDWLRLCVSCHRKYDRTRISS